MNVMKYEYDKKKNLIGLSFEVFHHKRMRIASQSAHLIK